MRFSLEQSKQIDFFFPRGGILGHRDWLLEKTVAFEHIIAIMILLVVPLIPQPVSLCHLL